MIGRLRGLLASKLPPELLIDVGGVFYEVMAPMTTIYQLPEEGQSVTLHTHLVIREDAQQLFGFHTLRERELFRALIRVNGVGPKLALTILSGMDADAFVACVHSKDHARLTAIPGIGKKTAERLIIETQDLLKGWQATQLTPQLSHAISNSASEDALSALKALGYKPQDAKKAIDRVFSEELNSEALIRLALQTMTQGA